MDKPPKKTSRKTTALPPLKEVVDKAVETIDEMNDALAEECFNQGNKLLVDKNRQGAIDQYREALCFAPHHTEISLKLADVLSSDAKTREEAEQVLTKASQLAPNNVTLRSRLVDLRKTTDKNKTESSAAKKSEPATPKKGTFNQPAKSEASSNLDTNFEVESLAKSSEPAKGTCSSCSLVNDAKETLCRRCYTPLNPNSKVAKFYGKQMKAISTLPTRIKSIDIVVLVFIGIVIIASLGLSRKEAILEVKPVKPTDQGVVSAMSPEFQWEYTEENGHFVFQVEDAGQNIIEHYTKDTFYTLSPEDMKKIKFGHFYKWRAIPVSPKREKLNYKSALSDFRILNAPMTTQQRQQQQ